MSSTIAPKTVAALAGKWLLPALLAWAPLAQAGLVTISQTESFDLPGSTTATLTLNEFDGSVGLLTEVSIVFKATSGNTNEIVIDCSAGTNPCEGSVGADASASLGRFDVGTISLGGFRQGKGAETECVVQAGQRKPCRVSVEVQIGGSDTATDAATLALFTDDTGLPLDTFSLVFNARSDNDVFSGSATVTYSYEERVAVPESSTLAGVATGLMALTATARRRGGSRRKG